MSASLESSWLRRAPRALLARIRRDPDLKRLTSQGLRLGRNVHLGEDVYLDTVAPWLISIGDDSVISMRVTILSHDNSTKLFFDYSAIGAVDIGCRVYIGGSSIILPNVTIGDGAVIGAGSVVKRDIPAGVVAVGNPAMVVGTVEQFVAKHRARLETGHRYDSLPYLPDGITPEAADEMRERLARGEQAYIP